MKSDILNLVLLLIAIIFASLFIITTFKRVNDKKTIEALKKRIVENNINNNNNKILVELLMNALIDPKIIVNGKVRNTFTVSATGGYTARVREKDKKVLKSGKLAYYIENGYIDVNTLVDLKNKTTIGNFITFIKDIPKYN